MSINKDISDLFLNSDIDGCYTRTGWNENRLLGEARHLLNILGRLGVPDLPQPEDIVDDFFKRIEEVT